MIILKTVTLGRFKFENVKSHGDAYWTFQNAGVFHTLEGAIAAANELAPAQDDGGPAFPREDYQTSDAPGQRGMSLRDWFAGQAAAAEVASAGANRHAAQALAAAAARAHRTIEQHIAWNAYGLADAMLEARKR